MNNNMGYKIITDNNLDARLKKCIEIRHSENFMTEQVRAAFASENDSETVGLFKAMMDNASALFCLADLAGMSVEEVVLGWVKFMEKTHPESLGENDNQPTK